MTNVDLYQVLKRPITTEKSTMTSDNGIYIFETIRKANKLQIAKAVELVFNVKVLEVNTLVRKGKSKIFKGRRGQRSDSKRAYVKLERDQKLDFNLGF